MKFLFLLMVPVLGCFNRKLKRTQPLDTSLNAIHMGGGLGFVETNLSAQIELLCSPDQPDVSAAQPQCLGLALQLFPQKPGTRLFSLPEFMAFILFGKTM